ncbi:hypothetical protein C8Q75DRAFT_811215 [Abortiporus biennis]|nr:hypothetical protein C8Q75DRAFT_811215 [Abortiporus biennis]
MSSPDPTEPWQSPTTPLRIAKRDSPQRLSQIGLARRQSNSYAHARHKQVVSKSPFRASTRRVSGEKRQREESENGQVEPEEMRKVAKRRQSRGFQNLIDHQMVSTSPFVKGRVASNESAEKVVLTPNRKLRKQVPQYFDDDVPPPPPPKVLSSRNSPSPLRPAISPGRSNLVSKRMHGPREAGVIQPRRSRRKTVTFDEQCQVMHFSVADEEMDENAFDWVTDEDDNIDYAHDPETPQSPPTAADESYDSAQAGNDSLTGMVDDLLMENQLHTPQHEDHSLPNDVENEDGVPYGRTHHAERLAMAHQHQADEDVDQIPFALHSNTVATPSNSRPGTPIGSLSPGSHIPLGRSTHSERLLAHKEEEQAGIEEDVQMLPPSPSPAKRTGVLPIVHSNKESLIPRFSLKPPMLYDLPRSPSSVPNGDPFALPSLPDEPRLSETSFLSDSSISRGHSHDELDPSNLSIGNSEVSLSGLGIDLETKIDLRSSTDIETQPTTSTPPTSSPPVQSLFTRFGRNDSRQSNSFDADEINLDSPPPATKLGSFNNLRSGSPSLHPRHSSPALSTGSPRQSFPLSQPAARSLLTSASTSSLNSPHGSLNGRSSPRISREDVQKRLLKKRSIESPLQEHGNSVASISELPHLPSTAQNSGRNTPETRRSSLLPSLSRNNPTHDGVMSIDPDPQSNDPPRPSVLERAMSTEGIEDTRKASSSFAGINLSFESSALNLGMPLGNMRSALDQFLDNVAGNATLGPDGKTITGLKIEAVTEGVKAGRYATPEVSMSQGANEHSRDAEIGSGIGHSEQDEQEKDDREEGDYDMEVDERRDDEDINMDHDFRQAPGPVPVMERASTDTVVLHGAFASPPMRFRSPAAAVLSPVPPPSGKSAIKAREELIKAKKREHRMLAEDGFEHDEVEELRATSRLSGSKARAGRRRSRSTGDTTPQKGGDGSLLPTVRIPEEELIDSIDKELVSRGTDRQTKYHIRERETIYASSDDRVAHIGDAGDVDEGRAWRTIRRPSDMNEYAKQIKQLREQDKSGKAYGKVFVKVLGIRNMVPPMPDRPTSFVCTLNNGIHSVRTPPSQLGRDCRIDQEFELIEHSTLEFTLTFNVDTSQPHIRSQITECTPPVRPQMPVLKPSPPLPVPASKGGGGFARLFRGSPKKPSKVPQPPMQLPTPPPPFRPPENLGRYLLKDGQLGRSFLTFKDIAKHCDTRLFETAVPLIGQKSDENGKLMQAEVGETLLQIFRLPPLPGIPNNKLPQSLEECHRGLRHMNWHKVTYYEGILTQCGGGCTSWRRRHFRVTGANLVAYNDVTKKAIGTIDLRKAVAVEDNQAARAALLSPASGVSTQSRYLDEFEGPYGVERSFRLIFTNNQDIHFFADTDDEKVRWMEILNALVGRIPENPLWAEAVWQRQQDMLRRQEEARQQEMHVPQMDYSRSTPSRLPQPVSPSPRRLVHDHE